MEFGILLILKIHSFCLTQPAELYHLCYEKTEACYYRQIEIEPETPKKKVIELCIGDYVDGVK